MNKILRIRRAKAAAVSMKIRLPMMILVGAILCVVISPLAASAECRWEWLCDASGKDCQKGAVCDSVHDSMPPPPPVPRPVVGPSEPPPPTPGSAPEGATDCRQMRRCDIDGNCTWDTLCLCL